MKLRKRHQRYKRSVNFWFLLSRHFISTKHYRWKHAALAIGEIGSIEGDCRIYVSPESVKAAEEAMLYGTSIMQNGKVVDRDRWVLDSDLYSGHEIQEEEV